MEKRDPRVERLAGRVPNWYSPLRHFSITVGILLVTVIGLLATLVSQGYVFTLKSYILIIASFCVGNTSEYLVHRYPMHKRYRKFKSFFKSHTITHHRFFTQKDMEMSRSQDLFFILPSYSVILFSLALLMTTFGLMSLVFGMLEAALFTSGLAFYGIMSELLHVAFHLPDSQLRHLLKLRLFRWMRRHHKLHHSPKVMRVWNFNIGIPLCDFVFGTLAPAELIKRADR